MSSYGFDTDYFGTSVRPYRSTLTRSPTRSVTAYSDKECRSRRHKSRKPSGSISKLDMPSYRRRPLASHCLTTSHTDIAYREAINRLKHLLSDSTYTPVAHQTTTLYTPFSSARSQFKDFTKYYPGTNIPRAATCYSSSNNLGSGSVPRPKETPPCSLSHEQSSQPSGHQHQELLAFIEKQENFIKQLEKENASCRDEVNSMKYKIDDLVADNDHLSRQIDRLQESSDSDDTTKHTKMVFESKINELESLLAREKSEVKRLLDENSRLQGKVVSGESLEQLESLRRKNSDLQRDKLDLEEKVRRLQSNLEAIKKDDHVYSRYLSPRESEPSSLSLHERNQMEFENKMLKDELEFQKKRFIELQEDTEHRVAEERRAAESYMNRKKTDIDSNSQWDYKLQSDLDRHRRIEADLKREISQKNHYIDDMKAEYRHKLKAMQSELNEVCAIRDRLESENTSLKLQLERHERQSSAEIDRLNADITGLRSRLDRSDSDLLQARREQLRLNEHISSLEKDVAISSISQGPRSRQEDFSRILTDIESKHASTVSELEGMIQSQKELMEKLTAECKTLTYKLEDATLRHKKDISTLQTNFQTLSSQLATPSNSLIAINNPTASSTISAPQLPKMLPSISNIYSPNLSSLSQLNTSMDSFEAHAPITTKPPQFPRSSSQESKHSPAREGTKPRTDSARNSFEKSYSKQEEYEGGKSSNDVAPSSKYDDAKQSYTDTLQQVPSSPARQKRSPTPSKYSAEEKPLEESPQRLWRTDEPKPKFRSEALRQLSQEMEQENGQRRPESRASIEPPILYEPTDTTTIREQYKFLPTKQEPEVSISQPVYPDTRLQTTTAPQTHYVSTPETRIEAQPQYVGTTENLYETQYIEPARHETQYPYETQPQYVGTTYQGPTVPPAASQYEPQYGPAETQPQQYDRQPYYELPQEQSQYRYEPEYQRGTNNGQPQYPVEYQPEYQYDPNQQQQPQPQQQQFQSVEQPYQYDQQQYRDSAGVSPQQYESQPVQESPQRSPPKYAPESIELSTLPATTATPTGGSITDLTTASRYAEQSQSKENVSTVVGSSTSGSPNQSPPTTGGRSKKSPSPPAQKTVMFEQSPVTQISQSITKQGTTPTTTAPSTTTTTTAAAAAANRRGTNRTLAARQANARARAQAAAAASRNK